MQSDLETLQSNFQHSFNKLQKLCKENDMRLNVEENKTNVNNY